MAGGLKGGRIGFADRALVSDGARSGHRPAGFDPSRGYAAALPHLRAARRAFLAAASGQDAPSAVDLLRRLAIAARTSGGTTGPDPELMLACDAAEEFLRRHASRSGMSDVTIASLPPFHPAANTAEGQHDHA